jgi:hypothetical protein
MLRQTALYRQHSQLQPHQDHDRRAISATFDGNSKMGNIVNDGYLLTVKPNLGLGGSLHIQVLDPFACLIDYIIIFGKTKT